MVGDAIGIFGKTFSIEASRKSTGPVAGDSKDSLLKWLTKLFDRTCALIMGLEERI